MKIKTRRGKPIRYIIVGLLVFLVIFVIFFLGIQFITKTGIFRIPGVVYYDDSLSENEIELLSK